MKRSEMIKLMFDVALDEENKNLNSVDEVNSFLLSKMEEAIKNDPTLQELKWENE